MSIFSAISEWEQYAFRRDDDDKVRFALDEHTQLDLYRASSLKQQFTGKDVVPFGHVVLNPSQPVFTLTV